jgi:hypothetical protein
MDQALRQSLLKMVDEARGLRSRLAADGSLFQGYNAQMRDMHNKHAKALADMADQHGWPGKALVGEDGSAAAWMIAQHAIGLPNFMRACFELIQEAVAKGDAPRWQEALLTDRIRWLEGKPQVYGTQFDWDAKGELNPLPIEDEANVDRRRLAASLKSLADGIVQRRKEATEAGEVAPRDPAGRKAEFEEWAKAIGWRS